LTTTDWPSSAIDNQSFIAEQLYVRQFHALFEFVCYDQPNRSRSCDQWILQASHFIAKCACRISVDSELLEEYFTCCQMSVGVHNMSILSDFEFLCRSFVCDYVIGINYRLRLENCVIDSSDYSAPSAIDMLLAECSAQWILSYTTGLIGCNRLEILLRSNTGWESSCKRKFSLRVCKMNQHGSKHNCAAYRRVCSGST
jgi:hypothetical protein